jgi:hypothetical protein
MFLGLPDSHPDPLDKGTDPTGHGSTTLVLGNPDFFFLLVSLLFSCYFSLRCEIILLQKNFTCYWYCTGIVLILLVDLLIPNSG